MEYLGPIGLVIALATMTRWMQRAWAVDIPSSPAVFQIAAASAVLLGVIAIAQGNEASSARWAVGIGAVFLYLSFTGAQRSGGEMIAVGDTIPAFTAPCDNGELFDSKSLAGTRVLLKFFRGHW